jgi:hypothetical protein
MTAVASPCTLPVGERVLVQLPHVGGLPATVEAVAGTSVQVVLAVVDARVRRLAGQEVAIEWTTGRGIQRFGGLLTIDGARGELLTIALRGDTERIQRREWARVQAVVPVDIQPLEPGVSAGETTSLNVSGGGVLICDPWSLPLGTDVRVELRLEGGSIHFLGRVVRDAGPGRKGVRIDDMGREDEERLIRFVRERERIELRMARGR